MKIHNINEFITSPDMSGYESPIRMIVGEMETKMEADTMSVIQRYGIDVDKEAVATKVKGKTLIYNDSILPRNALNYDREQYEKGYADACNNKNLWNVHQIACMLADIFKDRCACNYNGNDEWLPKVCDLADTSCPDTFGVACWEQFVANYDKRKSEGKV